MTDDEAHDDGDARASQSNSSPDVPSTQDGPTLDTASESAAAEPTPSRASRTPMIVIGVVGAVILLGIGIAWLVSSLGGDSSGHDISGVMTLADSDEFFAEGEPCEGSGGYDDIAAGADVTVKNESGEIIATSSLEAGTGSESGNCLFGFTIEGVPNAKFYAIEISHRGELRYSKEELEDQAWLVLPSLGR